MERNHSGLEDWKILFLSFHGWFVCSSRSSSRVYDLDPISFLVAKKVNYTTCHRSKGGLPGICSLVSGCQLVRTTLGSWRSRSWSTALGAGLWYSFVSGLDRIKLGGERRGSRCYHLAPEHVVFWRGADDDVVEKVVWECKQAGTFLRLMGLDFRCSPWKQWTRRQRTVPKPEFPETSKCGNCSEIPCPKILTSRCFLKTCQDRPVLVKCYTTAGLITPFSKGKGGIVGCKFPGEKNNTS